MAGKPTHDENKQRVGFSLTPTALENLEAMAKKLGIRSKSELIEQIARGLLSVDMQEQELQHLGESSSS